MYWPWQMEEREAESATIAGPAGPAPRPAHAAHDPLQTDIVQILAKIKGKVPTTYTFLSLMKELSIFMAYTLIKGRVSHTVDIHC